MNNLRKAQSMFESGSADEDLAEEVLRDVLEDLPKEI